jgi:hypothetical protein
LSRQNASEDSTVKSIKISERTHRSGTCSQRVHCGDRPCVSTIFALAALLVILPRSAAATPAEDFYIAGYTSAVLEREFKVRAATVRVKDGVVTLVEAQLGGAQTRDKVVSELLAIRGVVRVELSQAQVAATSPLGTQSAPGGTVETQAERPSYVFLPKDKLFRPLLADPRWPHFSLSYGHATTSRTKPQNIALTNFGETFPIVRGNLPVGQWEIGLQAGVFAIFDLDTPSKDLQNADYFVGIPVTYRWEGFSVLFRFFHQSSHLGDEFLLANPGVTRVNLSYEQFDLKFSQEFGDWLRVYGGAGYLVDQDPSNLKPWSAQGGVELTSPWTFLNGVARPLAALDVQYHQETNWNTNLSLRAGIQLESPVLSSTKLQLLGEYYDGNSPNGQFFQRRTKFAGFGVHMYF